MCVSIKAKIAACKCQNKDKQRCSRMHKVLHTKLNPFLKCMHLHKHTLTHCVQRHTITGGTFELQQWYSLCSSLASLTEPLLLSLLLLCLYLISSKEYFFTDLCSLFLLFMTWNKNPSTKSLEEFSETDSAGLRICFFPLFSLHQDFHSTNSKQFIL